MGEGRLGQDFFCGISLRITLLFYFKMVQLIHWRKLVLAADFTGELLQLINQAIGDHCQSLKEALWGGEFFSEVWWVQHVLSLWGQLLYHSHRMHAKQEGQLHIHGKSTLLFLWCWSSAYGCLHRYQTSLWYHSTYSNIKKHITVWAVHSHTFVPFFSCKEWLQHHPGVCLFLGWLKGLNDLFSGYLSIMARKTDSLSNLWCLLLTKNDNLLIEKL